MEVNQHEQEESQPPAHARQGEKGLSFLLRHGTVRGSFGLLHHDGPRRAVGLILLGWGIVQVGLSLQSHDPSQRSNGFLTLAGGIVITFAKEILTLITG